MNRISIFIARRLPEPLPEPKGAGRYDYYTKQKKGGHLRPENIDPVPLEEDPSDDDQKISKGIQVGSVLNGHRHVLNRKHEPGEEDRGYVEEEGGHQRLLLGPGDGGNEEPTLLPRADRWL